jgi:hypothetical protein
MLHVVRGSGAAVPVEVQSGTLLHDVYDSAAQAECRSAAGATTPWHGPHSAIRHSPTRQAATPLQQCPCITIAWHVRLAHINTLQHTTVMPPSSDCKTLPTLFESIKGDDLDMELAGAQT